MKKKLLLASLVKVTFLLMIFEFSFGCSATHNPVSNVNRSITSLSDLPDSRDKNDILKKLGTPMEIVLHEASQKAIEGPSYVWVYYFEYSKNKMIRRVAYSFQNGKNVQAPVIGFSGGDSYRILDSDNSEDILKACNTNSKNYQ